MMRAPHGRGWPHYLAGVALETLIFVVLGPFIGTVVFMAVFGILSGTAGGPVASLFVLVAFYPLFIPGYALSWKAAVVTGIVVSAATPVLRDRQRLFLFAAAVGAIVSVIAVPFEMGEVLRLSLGGSLVIAGAVAALACAHIGVRLWFPGRPTAASAS